MFVGTVDIDCGPYLLTFEDGSVNETVNIILKNDNIPECNETVTAHIVLGGSGGSTEGFRLGPQSSVSITIEDEGNCGN